MKDDVTIDEDRYLQDLNINSDEVDPYLGDEGQGPHMDDSMEDCTTTQTKALAMTSISNRKGSSAPSNWQSYTITE